MIEKIINVFLHADVYLNTLIQNYGNLVYLFLFFVIFMETGFVLTPFLPGDSLLFIAGALASSGALNVYILFILLSFAAIFGDTANYWIGRYFGEKVFSKMINPENMEKTKLFFKKHGKKAIIIARFAPIIRTFVPFVAGIGKMDYFTFLSYNVIGGVLWVGLFVFAGYFFGNIPIVKENLTWIILVIIVVSLIPAFLEFLKSRKKN